MMNICLFWWEQSDSPVVSALTYQANNPGFEFWNRVFCSISLIVLVGEPVCQLLSKKKVSGPMCIRICKRQKNPWLFLRQSCHLLGNQSSEIGLNQQDNQLFILPLLLVGGWWALHLDLLYWVWGWIGDWGGGSCCACWWPISMTLDNSDSEYEIPVLFPIIQHYIVGSCIEWSSHLQINIIIPAYDDLSCLMTTSRNRKTWAVQHRVIHGLGCHHTGCILASRYRPSDADWLQIYHAFSAHIWFEPILAWLGCWIQEVVGHCGWHMVGFISPYTNYKTICS